MKVDEVCSCGAALAIESALGVGDEIKHIRAWRREHRHEPQPTRGPRAIGFPIPGVDEEDD